MSVLKLRRDNSVVLKTVPFIIPAYDQNTSFESFVKDMEEKERIFLDNLSKDILS